MPCYKLISLLIKMTFEFLQKELPPTTSFLLNILTVKSDQDECPSSQQPNTEGCGIMCQKNFKLWIVLECQGCQNADNQDLITNTMDIVVQCHLRKALNLCVITAVGLSPWHSVHKCAINCWNDIQSKPVWTGIWLWQ